MSETNIIKSVLELRDNVCPGMQNYNIICDTAEYVSSCCYLVQHTSVERAKAYIENDFEYKKTLAYLEERGIKTSYDSLKQSICYANKVLKQMLGSDVISNLESGSEIARKRLILARNNIKGVLLSDVVEELPEFKYMRFSLEECVNELKFLAKFSKAYLESCMSKLDSRKLAYLNRLINTPSDDEVADSLKVLNWLSNPQSH